MQIVVNIPDELAAQVRARGLTPESYVEGLVSRHAKTPPDPSSADLLSQEQFNAALDAMTRYSDKIPSLPIDAFARESFYRDRD
jgi:hypothetical protein